MADPNIHNYMPHQMPNGSIITTCSWCGVQPADGKAGCRSPAQTEGKKFNKNSICIVIVFDCFVW